MHHANELHADARPLRFPQSPQFPPPVESWHIDGIATALHVDGEQFGRMDELTAIEYSHGEMWGISREWMQPGSSVSLGFQAQGYTARRGIVAACHPTGDGGCRVHIRFEARLAA